MIQLVVIAVGYLGAGYIVGRWHMLQIIRRDLAALEAMLEERQKQYFKQTKGE